MARHIPKSIEARLVAKPLRVRGGYEVKTHHPAKEVGETLSRIARLLHERPKIHWQRPSAENTPDCSVIVVPSFEKSIHELSDEFYEHRFSTHMFLVSLEDNETERERFEGIVGVAPIIAKKGEHIYTPEMQDISSVTNHIVSLHTIESLQKRYHRVLEGLNLVLAQKYLDYKRDDLDENGKTIQKKPFEDHDEKWIFLTDEETSGESWKGEGYTPPWEDEDEDI